MTGPEHVECAFFPLFSCSHMIIVQLRRVNRSSRPRTLSRVLTLAALNPPPHTDAVAAYSNPKHIDGTADIGCVIIGGSRVSCRTGDEGDIWVKYKVSLVDNIVVDFRACCFGCVNNFLHTIKCTQFIWVVGLPKFLSAVKWTCFSKIEFLTFDMQFMNFEFRV